MAITKAKLSYIDGITSSAAELNVLDGLTANTSELNYLDGISGVVASTASTGSSIIPSGTTAQRDGSPAVGYLRFNTTEASFEGYDGSSWAAVGGGINNQKLDDISSGFDSANTSFTLAVSSSAVSPASVNNVLISLNGVIQEPTTTYTISGSTITFTTAPDAGDTFFGLYYGTLSVGVPGDGSVGTAQLSSANIAFDTSTLFIDSTNNRVGVGTTSPTTTLNVAGNVTLEGASSPTLSITDSDTPTTAFIASTNSSTRFGSSTTTDMFLMSNNAYRVQIDGSTGDIGFYDSTSTNQDFFWDASASSLGIGTSSPSSLLHLAVSSGAGSPTISLERTDTTVSTTNTIGNIVFLAGEDGTEDTVAQISAIAEENFTTTSSATGIFFSTTPSGSTSATERVRIDASGNVLVGTTTQYGATGITLQQNGMGYFRRDSGTPLYLRRDTTDGDVIYMEKDGTKVGSIGTVSNTIGIHGKGTGDDATGLLFVESSVLPRIIPCQEDFTPNNGVVDLGHSNNRFKDLYLSGGAYLGGTAAANYLDDYEEGTWTPVFQGAGTAGSYTYFEQQGLYTKIGNMVTAWFNLTNITTSSSGSGNIEISGLPFTASFTTGFNGEAVGSIVVNDFNTINGNYTWPQVFAGGSKIVVYFQSGTNNYITGINVTGKNSNSADLRGFVTYQTAS